MSAYGLGNNGAGYRGMSRSEFMADIRRQMEQVEKAQWQELYWQIEDQVGPDETERWLATQPAYMTYREAIEAAKHYLSILEMEECECTPTGAMACPACRHANWRASIAEPIEYQPIEMEMEF